MLQQQRLHRRHQRAVRETEQEAQNAQLQQRIDPGHHGEQAGGEQQRGDQDARLPMRSPSRRGAGAEINAAMPGTAAIMPLDKGDIADVAGQLAE